MKIPMLLKFGLAVLLLALFWEFRVQAVDKPETPHEDTVIAVKYDGMTYEQALSGFQSELNPAIQAKALDTLIQFAIRDHHAEEVAGILVQECRTFPLEYLLEITEKSKEGMLRQLLEMIWNIPHGSTASPEPEGWLFSLDEMRHWRRILLGIYRLALPQRKVFEEAMLDPKSPFQARILARIAVQEADIQASVMQELLELMPKESATNAEIKVHDIVLVEVEEPAEVVVASWAEETEGQFQSRLEPIGSKTDEAETAYRIGAAVIDILPNGILILEGQKTIQTNQDVIEYRIHGRVPMSAVSENRTVNSKHLAELDIVRKRSGKIRNSSWVDWGVWALEFIPMNPGR